MASAEIVNQFIALKNRKDALDLEKIYRNSLSDAALTSAERDLVSLLLDRIELGAAVAHRVPASPASQARAQLDAFLREAESMTSHSTEAWVQSKRAFEERLDAILDQLHQYWDAFVVAHLEFAGFLKSSATESGFVGAIRAVIGEQLSPLVKEEADRVIKEAKALSDRIESQARDTAAGVSFAEGQKEFRAATTKDWIQLIVWSLVSILAVCFFYCKAIDFKNEALPTQWSWQFGYVASIRLAILAGIISLAGFAMKNLRSSLHMLNHNLHRKRLSNLVAAFGRRRRPLSSETQY